MKQRLSMIAAAVIALLAGVLWVAQGTPHKEAAPLPRVAAPQPLLTKAGPTPLPSPASTLSRSAAKLYSYAIATTELQGLAPDATPGTQLDLWIATQPPVSERPDVLPLLKGAILHEIVPPLLPDGPSAAILQVPLRHARKLMWADRFGSLSVLEVRSPLP